MTEQSYFEYETGDGRKYYYNSVTEETSFSRPTDGIIYDPTTMEVLYQPTPVTEVPDKTPPVESVPESDAPSSTKKGLPPIIPILAGSDSQTASKKKKTKSTKKHAVIVSPISPSADNSSRNDEDSDTENENEHEPNLTRSKFRSSAAAISVTSSDNTVKNLLETPPKIKRIELSQTPEEKAWSAISSAEVGDMKNQVDQNVLSQVLTDFNPPNYAKKHFETNPISGGIFKKKRKIKLEDMISFSDKPITAPLLKNCPKELKKICIENSKDILNFLGILKTKSPVTASQNLVTTLVQNPSLIDEFYFQVIRMTMNNPNLPWLLKAWDLLLIMTTFFPSSKGSELFIIAHILRASFDPEPRIQTIARFAYIRFESISCKRKLPKRPDLLRNVQEIPNHPQVAKNQYGVSLYEVMWSQRNTLPKLPIPYIEHLMAEQIINANGLHQDGLFRLPGNMKKVKEICTQLNQTSECIKSLPINDIGSIFKKWFRALPNPVVPFAMLSCFQVYCQQREFISFCYLLPKTHLFTLMYLIGFLKVCATHVDETRMGPKNLATVFGPNIVRVPKDASPSMLQSFSAMGNDFILNLIETWDTSAIYPLPADLL